MQAALKAGAHGAFLSGAGPTVVAFAGGDGGAAENGSDTMSQFQAENVAKQMLAAADEQGVAGSCHIAEPDPNGLASVGYDDEGTQLW